MGYPKRRNPAVIASLCTVALLALPRMALADDMQGYLNIKAYKDLAVENRPEGWSGWVTFALTPKAPEPPPTATPIVRKY
jgi:hypothetical protein